MDFLTKLDKLKKELEDLRPLSSDALEQLRQFYRIGLTYTSNALEGSTLTESETKIVLEDGLTVSGKPLRDHIDAVGHASAFDWLWALISIENQPYLTEESLCKLHQLIVSNQESLLAGQYRNKQVFISGTDYLPPEPSVLSEQMQKLIDSEWPQWLAQKHPVEAAALFHWKLVTIHPFLDGNGRVARLAMNLALLKSGYGITHIPPIRRLDYISTLAKSRNSHLTDEGATDFVSFICEMAYEGMKDYLRLVRHLQG